jgi:hypothetical protein
MHMVTKKLSESWPREHVRHYIRPAEVHWQAVNPGIFWRRTFIPEVLSTHSGSGAMLRVETPDSEACAQRGPDVRVRGSLVTRC